MYNFPLAASIATIQAMPICCVYWNSNNKFIKISGTNQLTKTINEINPH